MEVGFGYLWERVGWRDGNVGGGIGGGGGVGIEEMGWGVGGGEWRMEDIGTVPGYLFCPFSRAFFKGSTADKVCRQ